MATRARKMPWAEIRQMTLLEDFRSDEGPILTLHGKPAPPSPRVRDRHWAVHYGVVGVLRLELTSK
jgi:hypothetical protein